MGWTWAHFSERKTQGVIRRGTWLAKPLGSPPGKPGLPRGPWPESGASKACNRVKQDGPFKEATSVLIGFVLKEIPCKILLWILISLAPKHTLSSVCFMGLSPLLWFIGFTLSLLLDSSPTPRPLEPPSCPFSGTSSLLLRVSAYLFKMWPAEVHSKHAFWWKPSPKSKGAKMLTIIFWLLDY